MSTAGATESSTLSCSSPRGAPLLPVDFRIFHWCKLSPDRVQRKVRGYRVRGYDGAKQLVGRKRYILVDTEGLLLAVHVHPANIMDRDGIKLVLDEATRARLPRMRHLWLDAGYNGRGKGTDWVETVVGWTVQVLRAVHRFKRYWVPNDIPPEPIDWSQYLPAPGFHVLQGGGSSNERSLGFSATGASVASMSGSVPPA